jgi:hypothetical protein
MDPIMSGRYRRFFGDQPLTTTVCDAAVSPTRRSTSSGDRALDDRERDRAVLVVPSDRGDPPHLPVAEAHRRPGIREHVSRPVEVQEDQASRRPPEVVHAGDGLLGRGSSPCAGAPQCAASRPRARWCAVIGLGPEPRAPGHDAQRLGRPGTSQRSVADRGLESRPRHDELTPRTPLAGVPLDRSVGRRVTHEGGPRVDPRERLPRRRLGTDGLTEHRPVRRDVGDLDPQHEAHRVQPGHERRRAPPGLDRDPRRLPRRRRGAGRARCAPWARARATRATCEVPAR